MTVFYPILFVLINIVDAYTDRRIVVNHKRGAAIYTLICIAVSTLAYLVFDIKILDSIALSVLSRLAFFDPFFYLLKGKYRGIFFQEVKKLNGDKSIVDDTERWLGLPTVLARILYIKLYLIYLIFIYAG